MNQEPDCLGWIIAGVAALIALLLVTIILTGPTSSETSNRADKHGHTTGVNWR